MDVKMAIKNRRSVRKFTNRVPAEGDIKKMIEAGIWAPSGLNNQPWKFKIVSKGEIKDRIAECTKYKKIINAAPVAICVFLDKEVSYNREKDIMAMGACIQNMLLEALGLGLATCWLGEILNQRVKVEKILQTPSNIELMAVISAGYASEEPQSERKKFTEVIVK